MTYQNIGGIKYHVKGTSPKLVIHSGTHGDEYHVIKPLEKVISRLYQQLPDFLYVPEVSPSAVALRTRENNLGHDMNRIFWDSTDPEALANKQIMSIASNAIALTFHEDCENNAFYIYDSEDLSPEHLFCIRQNMKNWKLPLFNGFDDFEDLHLNYQFSEGYAVTRTKPQYKGPFVDDWARYHSHVSRMLTIEMPFEKAHVEDAIELVLRIGAELVEDAVYAQQEEDMLQYAS